ncbi:conserved membrane hypothetical protein [Bradyrhizobium sp. STM 3843]|uniref:hypothetical protein n=1 Tax=Bradyrhizobium sp. STM 3843 TaxID=551947 RepID=UPI0002403ABD|nr:hypothetical protein [Bradyrhizobium sp. STM 3843]CCE11491.1 conserved membrane hypothetical protein [Bradyrhizobium sp. STM 3843]
MSVTSVDRARGCGLMDGRAQILARVPAWFWAAVIVGVLVVLQGNNLLTDTDTFWQIKVGGWILAQHAVPHVDIYSWTKAGAPWISSSWLSQLLFAAAYQLAGWPGVVALSALAIAAAFALLVRVLSSRISIAAAGVVAMVAFALAQHHLLARPHVLAMPVMVAWVSGLIAAADRRAAPSPWLLPLLALWANIHGSFLLGLGLVAPIGLDAVWNAPAPRHKILAFKWALFGIGALIASCATPYGWDTLFAARKILDLGGVLALISEWGPVSFAQVSTFEVCLLLAIAAVLYFGVMLPPTRILLALGLLHMALSHDRHIEVFALLLPLVLLTPLAEKFGWPSDAAPAARSVATVTAVVAAVLLIIGVAALRPIRLAADEQFQPAIAALRAQNVTRVFNEDALGGYMIWKDMAPFIDGRSELYGEQFGLDYFNAVSLQDPNVLFRILDENKIEATLLLQSTPAAQLLDRLDGWHRVFANDWAVVHVRAVK